jgi:hypothetical protein
MSSASYFVWLIAVCKSDSLPGQRRGARALFPPRAPHLRRDSSERRVHFIKKQSGGRIYSVHVLVKTYKLDVRSNKFCAGVMR